MSDHPYAPGGAADAGQQAPPPPPMNLEAEQALLGIMMFENEAVHRLPAGLRPASFYEPFHGRLFEAIVETVNAGYTAEPTVLREEMRGDPGYEAFGGFRYLADLVDRAPPVSQAQDYARVIVGLGVRRALIEFGEGLARRARDDAGLKTGDALIAEAETTLLDLQVGHRSGELTTLDDAVDGTIAYVEDRSAPSGVESGLRPLDLQLGPMLAGDLLLLAGRPSMGKSAVGLSIALNIAAPELGNELNGLDLPAIALPPPGGVIEVHGEMTYGNRDQGGQVVRRHMTDVGYAMFGADFPKFSDIRKKKVSDDQLRMMVAVRDRLRGLPIKGIKRTGASVSTIRSLVRRQASDWARAGVPLRLVMVDHVGLLRPENDSRGRYDAQTEIAIAMKELAGELGVPVLALVQLNRNVEQRDDKRPMLSDLRESGAWEENADAVIMAYRDAYYAQREPEPDMTKGAGMDWAKWDERRKSKEIDLLLPKVREGDAGGVARVWGDLAWNAIRGAQPNFRDLI